MRLLRRWVSFCAQLQFHLIQGLITDSRQLVPDYLQDFTIDTYQQQYRHLRSGGGPDCAFIPQHSHWRCIWKLLFLLTRGGGRLNNLFPMVFRFRLGVVIR